MMVVWARESAQARMGSCVVGLDVPFFVAPSHLPTFLDHALGHGAQSGDPIVRQEFFEQNEAIFEVALTLLLAEDLSRNGQDLVRRHGHLLHPKSKVWANRDNAASSTVALIAEQVRRL